MLINIDKRIGNIHKYLQIQKYYYHYQKSLYRLQTIWLYYIWLY